MQAQTPKPLEREIFVKQNIDAQFKSHSSSQQAIDEIEQDVYSHQSEKSRRKRKDREIKSNADQEPNYSSAKTAIVDNNKNSIILK